MNGLTYLQRIQCAWALRTKLEPIGSTFKNEGEKNYVEKLDDNLFQILTQETLNQLKDGDGNETKDYVKNGKHYRPKINALHSSSAIAVNMFQYWQNKDVYPILYSCKLCSKQSSDENIMFESIVSNSIKNNSMPENISSQKIKFEEKFVISDDKKKFPRSPNIDVVVDNFQNQIFAIESKFSEPYRYKSKKKEKKTLSERYVDDISLWKNLDNLYELAKTISKENINSYLDSTQLIKHILGLTKNHNKSNFRLLYLWYDVVGQDGFEHRKEIEQFAEIAKKDNVRFSHITYQEVILKLSKEFYEGNEEYVNYLTDRYI